MRGSEEEKNWKRQNPEGYKLHEFLGVHTGATDLHKATALQDTEDIRRLLKEKPHLVNVRDVNGWMPLHVSSRCCRFYFHLDWIQLCGSLKYYTGGCQIGTP